MIDTPRSANSDEVRGGGVATLFHSAFSCHQLKLPTQPQTCEYIAADLQALSHHIVVATVYRPGSVSVSQPFFDELQEFLAFFATYSCPILILGDFNIHVEQLNNTTTECFTALLDVFSMQQIVNCPTHQSGGTLDLIISRCDSAVALCNVRELQSSDHFLVQGVIPWPTSNILDQDHSYTVHTRIWRSFVLDDFRNALSSSVLCTPPLDSAHQSLDNLFFTYSSVINNLLDRFAPHRTVKVRCRDHAPWFDIDCRWHKRLVRHAE